MRRKPLDIIAAILEACKQPTPKTKIMFKAELSPLCLQRYLKLLEPNQLIKEVPKKEYPTSLRGRRIKHVYKTTHKGHQLLKHHNAIKKLLKPQEKGRG